jgi:sulfur-oxidizing protein SoxB
VTVRVGGLRYSCAPNAKMGARISDLSLAGRPIEATKKYKVAGWAPVSAASKAAGGEPIWDLMARYLRGRKLIKPLQLELPRLKGVEGNAGIA